MLWTATVSLCNSTSGSGVHTPALQSHPGNSDHYREFHIALFEVSELQEHPGCPCQGMEECVWPRAAQETMQQLDAAS